MIAVSKQKRPGSPAQAAEQRESGPIRVLALMEAYSLTGPAKNLLQFATRAAQPRPGFRQAQVAVATFQRSRSGAALENDFIRACQRAQIELHVIPERCAFDPRILLAFRELLMSVKPAIVQTHSVKSHFLMKLIGRPRPFKWIAFHHGYTWPNIKMRMYNQLDRVSLLSADRVITVSRPFACELEKIGVPKERVDVHHNAVKPFVPASAEEVVELRTRLAIPEEAAVILTVGRLSREKGHIDLIEALVRVHQANRKRVVRLVIVGDGREREHIQHRAHQAGIANLIIMPGHQSEIAKYYSAADLVVLPSHSEGCPNVLLEAMSAGIATVATRVGGVPEIATPEQDSLLVEKGDCDAMARAINRLLDNPRLRECLGKAAQVRAEAFTVEAYCDGIVSTYGEVLGTSTFSEEVVFSRGREVCSGRAE